MFTVIEKDTGKQFTVYAVQGQYFLIYDEDNFGWGYKNMDRFIPVKAGGKL